MRSLITLIIKVYKRWKFNFNSSFRIRTSPLRTSFTGSVPSPPKTSCRLSSSKTAWMPAISWTCSARIPCHDAPLTLTTIRPCRSLLWAWAWRWDFLGCRTATGSLGSLRARNPASGNPFCLFSLQSASELWIHRQAHASRKPPLFFCL